MAPCLLLVVCVFVGLLPNIVVVLVFVGVSGASVFVFVVSF